MDFDVATLRVDERSWQLEGSACGIHVVSFHDFAGYDFERDEHAFGIGYRYGLGSLSESCAACVHHVSSEWACTSPVFVYPIGWHRWHEILVEDGGGRVGAYDLDRFDFGAVFA